MDEPETKTCSNCKREIPAVNFTIHTVHCARNIKVCPVCKEPVPLADLADHHETMHKLLPCKKCGEQVCGTDLEDHIRDSCAHTIQTCKFCELELPRRDLPLHEGYCGVRTEQCDQCREWVMIKYRQLHLDSNHGFLRLDDGSYNYTQSYITTYRVTYMMKYRQLHLDSNHGFLRLDDDPPPPKKEVAKVARLPKHSNITAASTSQVSSNGPIGTSNGTTAGPSTSNAPRTIINRFSENDDREKGTKEVDEQDESTRIWRQRAFLETSRQVKLPKRTNDQPQINTNTEEKPKNTTKKLINKKRQAPPPPSPEPRRDLPYYSAMQRKQDEEQLRREQTAYNLARGLPPVLSPAAKLERLRKMDRLANWDTEPGPSRPQPQSNNDTEQRWNPEELRNLKPMTPEQFERRFNALRLASDSGGASGASGSSSGTSGNGSGANKNINVANKNNIGASRNNSGANGNDMRTNGNDGAASRNNWSANGRADRQAAGDRFNEIKSSLRELRRGLNEVTAPYNSNPVNNDS
ncbi:hypothetical protein evm_006230 [Chilo suppressalis]|nr:hypothetical protein evm_006230 [Chilo suppressalis]